MQQQVDVEDVTTEQWINARFAQAASGEAGRVVPHVRARWIERAEDALDGWDQAREDVAQVSGDELAQLGYECLVAHQSLKRLRDQDMLTSLLDAFAETIARDGLVLEAALSVPSPQGWLEAAARLCEISSADPIDWDDALINAAWSSWQELDEALLAVDALRALGVDCEALEALDDELTECLVWLDDHAWAWLPAEGPIRASASALQPPSFEGVRGFAWTQLYLNQLAVIEQWEPMEGLVALAVSEALDAARTDDLL